MEQHFFGQSMNPCGKIFGNNCQILLLVNQQIFMVDSMKNMFPSISFFWQALPTRVLSKDPTVRLDGSGQPQNIFRSI
jgi:hypothetical protein